MTFNLSLGTDSSVTFELYSDADFSTWRDFTAIHLDINKRFISKILVDFHSTFQMQFTYKKNLSCSGSKL